MHVFAPDELTVYLIRYDQQIVFYCHITYCFKIFPVEYGSSWIIRGADDYYLCSRGYRLSERVRVDVEVGFLVQCIVNWLCFELFHYG